jgi:hypothetical protein
MGRLTRTLLDKAFGIGDPAQEGLTRTLGGLRRGDQRELFLGLALSAVAYLNRTRPSKRRLLFRETVPVGSAIVVHHRERGAPRIEVIKPDG